jgi:hypothetical protein
MDWQVVIWTNSNDGRSTEFDTKSSAYVFANEHCNAYYLDRVGVAIEIYGPNGFYDCIE